MDTDVLETPGIIWYSSLLLIILRIYLPGVKKKKRPPKSAPVTHEYA